jgi:hypothetical protein
MTRKSTTRVQRDKQRAKIARATDPEAVLEEIMRAHPASTRDEVIAMVALLDAEERQQLTGETVRKILARS